VLAIIVTQIFAWVFYKHDRENEFLIVQQETANVTAQIMNVLNSSIRATKTLAFLIENDLMTDDLFASVSGQLLAENSPIDALQLVEGTFITHTFPLEGNEVTIGYEVLAEENHYREAMTALERRQLYFDGPFDLRQGGRGMVGRLPVLKDGEYWGFTAVVIYVDTFIEAIGLGAGDQNDFFTYQISKGADERDSERFFPGVRNYNSGVYHSSFVPLGNWNVHVKLKESRSAFNYALLVLFGLILSSTVTLFTYNLSTQPEELQRQVDEKTRDLEQLNREITQHVKELEISNQELEQFAYIASHDLQEPLRMITSFVGRIRDKYSDRLDDKGLMYISFATEGAARMRRIILDLLEYSRVGREEDCVQEVDLNQVVHDYISTRNKLIRETRAGIQYDALPKLTHYPAAIAQIFHNLLDNAIKYSKENIPPQIRIEAADMGSHWQFTVSDNGIGIDEEYYEKIFVIFNRLHPRDQYEGSGIGLATIKKILTSLDEVIWLESTPGVGTTFFFTLKKL